MRSQRTTQGAHYNVALMRLTLLLALTATLVLPGAALAQTDKLISAGGGVAFYHPIDDSARNSTGFALVYRFGRGEGWRPAIGLNWFNTTFDATIAGSRVEFGDLRVRPIMAGYGYTARRGRFAATASGVAGVAFNSFDAARPARLAYAQEDRVLLDVSAGNSLAARAEVAMWYDLNSRFGILGVVGYIVARPEIDVVTDAGTDSRRLKADSLKLQIGVAYGIF
jgi:hypothetical protein